MLSHGNVRQNQHLGHLKLEALLLKVVRLDARVLAQVPPHAQRDCVIADHLVIKIKLNSDK